MQARQVGCSPFHTPSSVSRARTLRLQEQKQRQLASRGPPAIRLEIKEVDIVNGADRP